MSQPRQSSSLIVVDENNRVLMVERSPDSTSYSRAYVFPGGNRDAQDTSERITAIRETFEEAGLLLASPTRSLSKEALDLARKSIHAQTLSFTNFLAQNNLNPDVDSLLPFTQWITPIHMKRRFHTHFYITFLPSTSSAGLFSNQSWQHYVPIPDGGIEVISARFLTPQDAISKFRTNEILLMPPQFYILSTLAPVLTGSRNTLDQRETVARLAKGAFGSLIINPMVLPEKDEQGLIILAYEGDEAKGGRAGARHRAHVKSRKEGVSALLCIGDASFTDPPDKLQVITLERNIDIFSDESFQRIAKL